MAGLNPTSILLGFIFAPQVIQSITSLYPAFQVQVAKNSFAKTPNVVTSPSELVSQAQKGIIDHTRFINSMMDAGFAPAHAEEMLRNARTYISALDYVTAWRRGVMSESLLDENLAEQGLNAQDIATLKEVTIYFPTPQDLVRFGVREVFTPNIVDEYGLDEDYPKNLDAQAVMAGLTPEIAKWYWRAHWELPSPTQVYDMLHRKLLTPQQVETYLKTADYMPAWRDKLIALSYDNITRVDIRRMYSMGVLNRDQVKDRYERIGYNPEDAELLTQFTELAAKHEDTNTPVTTIIASYKAGTIDRGTAFDRLLIAKMSMSDAELTLDNADAEIKQDLIDIEADALTDQYRQNVIDINDYRNALIKLGVPQRMLELTIAREIAQSKRREKNYTKTDLDSWWRIGAIGTKQYTEFMKNLGYRTTDITRYLMELEVGDLVGADKKYPWGNALRDYMDGIIDKSTLDTRVAESTSDTTITDKILSLAAGLKY